MRAAAALVALLAALALAACGGEDEGTESAAPADASSSQTTPATPAATTQQEATPVDDSSAGSRMVASYLVRDGRVAPVRRLVGSGQPRLQPVLEQLLAGPTADELAGGYTTAIPPGVEVLGVRGEGTDTVTIDLSTAFGAVSGDPAAERLALAQVVHTAIHEQGPSVGVRVELGGLTAAWGLGDGGPLTVADVEDVTPPVVVQWPLPGDKASCPQRVTGTSNTFEASSLLGFSATTDALPEGDPTIVTASSGNGTRGTFDLSVPCPDPAPDDTAFLVSWFGSAEDGSAQAVQHIPLRFP